jgi:hypothetical protein
MTHDWLVFGWKTAICYAIPMFVFEPNTMLNVWESMVVAPNTEGENILWLPLAFVSQMCLFF